VDSINKNTMAAFFMVSFPWFSDLFCTRISKKAVMKHMLSMVRMSSPQAHGQCLSIPFLFPYRPLFGLLRRRMAVHRSEADAGEGS